MPPALKRFVADGGVKVVNRYREFRKCHGLNKPSLVYSLDIYRRVIWDDEELPTEIILELQFYRLSRCWADGGNVDIGKGTPGRGRGGCTKAETLGRVVTSRKWSPGAYKIQRLGPHYKGALVLMDWAMGISRGVTHPLGLTEGPLVVV